MLTQIIGLGAGGHAKVVVDLIRVSGGFDVVGLLDARSESHGQEVVGIRILGADDLLPGLMAKGISTFFIGVGTVGNATPRQRLYELARSYGMHAPVLKHPSSIIASTVSLDFGTVVMAGAILNAGSQIGANVIINTGAIVEHDCILGDHVHVATGARLLGAVTVGQSAHIGGGATVRQGIHVGEAAIVGAGAVVVRDVPPHTVVVGVPAQAMKPRTNRG